VNVTYAPRARRDLARIRDYIWGESKSREVADRFVSRLIDACDHLGALPLRYPTYSHRKDTHMMPFRNYVVFFKVNRREVQIRHVRHAARRPFRK
jgi:plasmid stabilization system protein ParE